MQVRSWLIAASSATLLAAVGAAPAQAIPTCEKLADDATIRGTNGPDVIHGTRESDVIFARGGNDVIKGHGGFGDTICAGRGDDEATGRAGQDFLFGGPGDDRLKGRSGSDRFWPGPGVDLVDGDDGSADQVHYGLAGGPVVADITTGTATGEGADTLLQIGNIEGSAFDDELTGGPWQNLIEGGPGDDEIFGLGRQDDLFGGSGDDQLFGGGGDDRLRGGTEGENGPGDSGDGGPDTDECLTLEAELNCEG